MFRGEAPTRTRKQARARRQRTSWLSSSPTAHHHQQQSSPTIIIICLSAACFPEAAKLTSVRVGRSLARGHSECGRKTAREQGSDPRIDASRPRPERQDTKEILEVRKIDLIRFDTCSLGAVDRQPLFNMTCRQKNA